MSVEACSRVDPSVLPEQIYCGPLNLHVGISSVGT